MIACVWERERDHSGEVGGGCRGGGRLERYLGAQYVSPCLPPKAAFTKRFTRQVSGVLRCPAL